MNGFGQDLLFGIRTLMQRPSFTAVAVATLALGIGATVAIFSVVDAVLLRPLPYVQPERLVVMWEANGSLNLPFMNVAPPNFADWQARNRSFERIGAWRERGYTIDTAGAPEKVHGADVSKDLLELLGVAPLLGRTFSADEDRPSGPQVAIISHGLWTRAFGADPAVVGSRMRIDGVARQIVGVMPKGFGFPLPVAFEGVPAPKVNDVWLPLGIDYAGGQRSAHYLLALGRLEPGVDVASAERELVGIAAQIAAEHPSSNANWTVKLVPFARQVTGDQRPALLALSIAVTLVLLLACANVAGLLLARGAGRRQEIAIRLALGATRLRVARQLFTESLVLTSAGAAGGLLLSAWLTRTIRALGGPMLPRLDEVALDERAILFTACAAAGAAALFGIGPAVQLARGGGTESLKDRSGTGRTGRLQPALVVSEIALSMVLLAGAALLGQSFVRLLATDPGFRQDQILTAHVSLPSAKYANHPDRLAFVERAVDRISAIPGVEAAAVVDALPLADDRQGTGFSIEGEPASAAVDAANINFAFVSPAYLEALGIPVVSGRGFDARDRRDSTPTVIVNASFAKRFFGGRDPVGRRIRLGFNTNTPREIVGVVGDERHVSLDREAPPGVFVSYLQYGFPAKLTLVARTAGDPSLAAAPLREAVREIDANLAVYDVRTMEQIVSASVSRPRFSAVLLGLFAATALLLAAVGVYGVISQIVSQRTREFGVRMALGAAPRDVARLVLRFGATLAVIGVAVGIPAALLFARVISGLLFGVTATSPLTYTVVAAALGIVALLAALIPAQRATRVDPLTALRAD